MRPGMPAHMTSWRDTTSEAAQHDLDGSLNAVVPFAEQTLAKYGEIFPFGAAVSSEGVVEMMAADVGQGDQPPSAEILDLLYEGARESADTRRAVAFVADVRNEGGDATASSWSTARGHRSSSSSLTRGAGSGRTSRSGR